MGLGPSRFVFWGAGGGELHVSVGPQPWLLPRSTRFTSPLHSGLFSITQGSPVTGWNSKPKPNMWRWAPDRAKPAETSEPVPRRCHDNGAHQRGDRRTERGRDGRSRQSVARLDCAAAAACRTGQSAKVPRCLSPLRG